VADAAAILREQKRLADYTVATSKRVGVLEKKVARLLGWVAGVGAAVSAIVAAVKELLWR
jgi:hypothetical protein